MMLTTTRAKRMYANFVNAKLEWLKSRQGIDCREMAVSTLRRSENEIEAIMFSNSITMLILDKEKTQ